MCGQVTVSIEHDLASALDQSKTGKLIFRLWEKVEGSVLTPVNDKKILFSVWWSQVGGRMMSPVHITEHQNHVRGCRSPRPYDWMLPRHVTGKGH